MKNLNKVFAMLLVAAMMMTSVVFADFSDVPADSVYAEAVNVGAALGLFKGYEDGTFKTEGDITRAEFAAIVVRAMNQESQATSASSAPSDFTDVAEDHWAKGYINIVSKMGIVNGYGDGTFGPEDNVLFEQAVKMLVIALGYEPAIGSAGYPVGYLTKAADIGITTGVSASNGVAANRGVVAQLVLNAIDTPIMKQTGYGTWVDYVIQDGYNDTTRQTLMSENLGVIKLRVTVNESSATSNSGKYADEYVKCTILNSYKSKYTADEFTDNNGAYLSSYQITVGDTILSSLVGANAIVYAYYDENSKDDPLAVYAAKDTTKTYEMTVSSDDFDAVSSKAIDDTSVAANSAKDIITFDYWENPSDRKVSSITVSANPKVYINGGLASETTSKAVDALKNYYGYASFQRLNSDTVEDYDTVFIKNYQTLVVDEVSSTRYKVISKNNADSVSFDPDDTTIKATLYDENGEEINWADLKEWDIVSIAKYKSDKNKTIIEGTLLTTTVTGAVTGISDEGTDDVEYTIGGETYGIDPNALDNDEIALADEGTFYLDIMGNICYYDTTESISSNYAFIVKVGDNGSSLDSRAALKLYTFDGQYGTINTASKVKIDGISGIDSSKDLSVDIAAAKSESETTQLVKKQGADWFNFKAADNKEIASIKALAPGQVITYNVNSSGYITSIDRAFQVSGLNDVKGKFTQYNGKTSVLTYNDNTEAFTGAGKKLFVTDKTVIMVAPYLDEDGNAVKVNNQPITPADLTEDDFTLFSTANIADEQELKNAYAYNVDEDGNVGFILVATDVDQVDSGAIMALVTGTGSANNASGDSIYNVKVLQDGLVKDGKANAALTTNEDNLYGIENYATIVPKYNSAGEIKGADILAKISGTTVDFSGVPADSGKVKYTYGKVTDRNKKTLDIETGRGTDISVASGTNVYVYDSGASTNYKCTVDGVDVIDFEGTQCYVGTSACTAYAIAREYDGDIVDVVIYIFR